MTSAEKVGTEEGRYAPHPSYKLCLTDEYTGRTTHCMFKPKIKGDGEGWHRAPMEYVAYRLCRILGMDYVPPVAYRKGGIDVDYKRFEEGAFIHWVPNTCELREADQGEWGADRDHVLSDTR